MTEERQLFYFVRNGKMYSANVIATLDFSLETEKERPFSEIECFKYFFGTSSLSEPCPTNKAKEYIDFDKVKEYINRPGTWCLMSGMRIVHGDDLFETREQAAEDAYNKLMETK